MKLFDFQRDRSLLKSGNRDCRVAAERIVMKTKTEKGRIGQRFDDFLREQGCYEESTNQAVKRVIAHQLAAAMEAEQLTKSAFARKLKTSRSQLDRLLDPENTKATLDGLSRAAQAVGRELQLELR